MRVCWSRSPGMTPRFRSVLVPLFFSQHQWRTRDFGAPHDLGPRRSPMVAMGQRRPWRWPSTALGTMVHGVQGPRPAVAPRRWVDQWRRSMHVMLLCLHRCMHKILQIISLRALAIKNCTAPLASLVYRHGSCSRTSRKYIDRRKITRT
jgi:hypothetical protein